MTDEIKVGDLARRTGMSVRTLHHYEEIGLLPQTRRTPAGHRLYGKDEVERLQRIVSLRRLGLSLEQVRECLARPDYSLERVLDMQIEILAQEVQRQRRLQGILERLRARIRAAETISVDELTQAIEVTMSHERYYTPEQLRLLEQRGDELGQDRIEAVQREWTELFEAYAAAMRQGLDPDCDDVLALAKRSAALIGEFTGGDPGIAASMGEMYRLEGPERVLEGHGMSMVPGLWEYMGKATAALRARG